MAIDLATGFNIGSKDVIDERQVLTLEQMKNLDETIYPDNYFAMCKDNGKFYIFNSSNAINNTTGKFRLLEGNGGSGSTEGTKTYTSLSELELTPDVTIDDVVSALNDGETALIATSEFTNYLTMFPNQCDNDQYAMLKVEKSNSSSVLLEWLQKEGNAYAIGGLDDSNKFTNWNNLVRFKKDGFGDDNIISIGNTVSDDGSIQTLANLGLSKDIMTWETGIYKCSDVSGLTNLPSDVSSIAPAHFRLEHHNIQKWTDGRSPSNSIGGQRHSFYYSEGDVYHRYTESGDTPGVFIKDTGWTKICTDVSIITELENKLIKTYNTLDDLGLTAPVTVGEIYNAMADNSITILDCDDIADHITDVPVSCGVLTIKKKNSNRFSIDYQNSLGGNVANVKRWIATLQGLDGRGLTWKLLSTNATYTTLSDMGLTADATIQDAIDALPIGCTSLLRTDAFTNWSTLFNGIQYGYFKVEKTINGLSNIELQEVVLPNRRYFGTQASGKFSKWQQVHTENVKAITSDMIAEYGTEILKYPVGTWRIDSLNMGKQFTDLPLTEMAGVIEIVSIVPTKSPYEHSYAYRNYTFRDALTNNIYIRSLNSSATAGTVQRDSGWQKMITEKSDPYACTSYTALTGTEDLFTLPCGHYVSAKINTAYNYPITDSSNATAHIYVLGHLNEPKNNKGYRIILYFDNKGRMYTANEWWGSFNAWSKLDNDNRITTLETQVSELFQSVSDGKKLVANAITGKGVSTSTTATFATMATNISKINGSSYKEETKSYTLNQSGTQALTFTFSANVIAVKTILAPYDGYSGQGYCSVSAATSVKDVFKIEGKVVTFYATGTGTWQVKALVQA